MDTERAQLLSISTGLDDLTDRVTETAERYASSPQEDVATDLFEVERSLRLAQRRLRRLLRHLS